jgi:hypothetical protein
VVLNSCEGARGSRRDIFSSTSSILVRRGIPAVVAMQYPISDEAAIEFSRSFYESLISGLPVDTSMAEARKAMSAAFPGGVEWGTPVLYMRSQDGVLFTIDRSRSRSPPAVPDPAPAPVPVKEKAAAETRSCKICGNTILAGQKFCSRCMVSVSPDPVAPAIPATGSSVKPEDGTRFCTECGNAILPGETSCSRCHPVRTPAPETKPVVPEAIPPVKNIEIPPGIIPVKTGTDSEQQPAGYPTGLNFLGILNVLGALLVLWIQSTFFTNATVAGFSWILWMSGVVLFICGIMMLFRQPKISHLLLILNFILAIFAYLVIIVIGLGGSAFNPLTIIFWFIVFVFPGACVSGFFYPLKSKYHL